MLTKELVQEELGRCNGDAKRAAESLGVPHTTLLHCIWRHGIVFKSKRASIDPTNLQLLYDELGSLAAVAKEIGANKEGVRCAMKRYGMRIKKQVIHTLDDDFFSHDNEKSFYWAGFLAADGNVRQRNNKTGKSESSGISLALGISDKAHVEKFIKDINSTALVGVYLVKNSKRNSKWNDTEKAEVKLTSKKMFEDLARFNIVPRKSLVYTFPEWLVQHPLVRHYMRGYFDGDGSFYWTRYNTKADQEYFNLRGTTEFLEIYRSILEKECGLVERDKPIRMNTGIGALEYGGNVVLGKIREYLFKDAETYLDRKWASDSPEASEKAT